MVQKALSTERSMNRWHHACWIFPAFLWLIGIGRRAPGVKLEVEPARYSPTYSHRDNGCCASESKCLALRRNRVRFSRYRVLSGYSGNLFRPKFVRNLEHCHTLTRTSSIRDRSVWTFLYHCGTYTSHLEHPARIRRNQSPIGTFGNHWTIALC